MRRVRSLIRRHGAPTRSTRRWASRSFGDLALPDEDRDLFVDGLTARAGVLEWRARLWRLGLGSDASLARGAVAYASCVDDGRRWLPELGPRSYVDASLQAHVLRRLLEHLAPRRTLALARTVAGHAPASRAALLVLGELLLEAGDPDGAVEAARRALRTQAVCPSAQGLLMRAHRARPDASPAEPEVALATLDLSDRFCEMPFTHLSTGAGGETFVCSCPAWVPYSAGNVFDGDAPDDIWNSAPAQEIRRSILDGDFSYCSRTQCSLLQTNRLPRRDEVDDTVLRRYIDEHVTRVEEAPRLIELNHDPTCNLACPSCRTEIVAAPRSDRPRLERAAERVLLPLMRETDGWAYISGGGEALSSPHFRTILRSLNRAEYPGLGIYLITNAQLATPRRWSSLPHLEEMLAVVSVSIDAARPDTYERLRRPGRWDVLMRNLEFLADLRRAGRIPLLELNFVVQHENFRQILEFADLGQRLGADRIWYQRLVNYGSYDEQTFATLDVASPSHPDHEEMLGYLRELRARGTRVNMAMLLGLLPEFVASDEPLAMAP